MWVQSSADLAATLPAEKILESSRYIYRYEVMIFSRCYELSVS
jgi:hypothetical protein